MANEPQEKKKCTKLCKVCLIVLLLLIMLLLLRSCFLRPCGQSSNFFDKGASEISLEGKTPEKIQEELNRVVEEGMFHISILPEVYFPDGTSPGEVRVENVKSNHYHMKLSIALDDTGEVIYESGGIKPGQGIRQITLNKDLPRGEYPAIATFTAFDQTSLKEVGQAAASIMIVVEQ